MKLKVVVAIMGLVLLGVNVASSQIVGYSEEALLMSRSQPGGSARIQGMGGVQTSLGGDVSSAYYNPAGLGMYNRSDFSISPAYSMANYSGGYLGNTDSQNKNNISIPNFGIAFHTAKDGQKGFWGGTFAINYTRVNDFNFGFTYHGKNLDNSIIDRFLESANGSTVAQFNPDTGGNFNTPTGLAYNNYLIGPDAADPSGKTYFTDVYPYLPTQTEVVKNTGAHNQWNFSYGVNFNDKIFLGAGIGFSTFRYKSETTYTETFLDPFLDQNGNPIPQPYSPMSKMVLQESLSISGSGINATVGAIFRPIDQLQVGLSVATPTAYQITDNYFGTMSTNWNNFTYEPGVVLNNESFSTDNVTSDYNLSTPWRIGAGGTFFIQKKGFISADVEWLNYSNNKYTAAFGGDSYDFENNEIKSLYKSTLNVRLGGEYRLNSYRFRAGYRYMPDPRKASQDGIDNSIEAFSMGLGYRASKFYIDLAGVLTQSDQSYRPYVVKGIVNSPVVNLKNQTTSFIITLGFPF